MWRGSGTGRSDAVMHESTAGLCLQNGGRHGSEIKGGSILSQLSSRPGASRLQQITSMWTGAFPPAAAARHCPMGHSTPSSCT